MKRIEFGELRIGEIARKNLMEVCDSNWASMGAKVKQFEERWSEIFGYQHSIAVSSGTDAVINACLALFDFGAKRGDEVIVPALSFIATSNAVRAANLNPVFVDIEASTLNINPDLIEAAITDKTRAILVVHTMGRMCEMDKICDIAKRHNLLIIEDCAESPGAQYKGKLCGHWGDMFCTSFYIAHLVCCGEGGMVSTNSQDIADVLRSTRSHGRKNGDLFFDHVRVGYNSKMNDLEASLGLEAIDVFWQTFDTRKKHYYKIREALEPYQHLFYISEEDEGNINCPHGFSITPKYYYLGNSSTLAPRIDMDALKLAFDNANIHWKKNFGSIPTQHKAFADMGYKLGDFPQAEFSASGIHWGLHQYLTDDDVDRIINTLLSFFESVK